MSFLLALLPVWNVIKAIFSGLLTFFAKPPGIYILAVCLVIGAVWWNGKIGFNRGVVQERQEQALALARAREAGALEGMKRQAALDARMGTIAYQAGFKAGKAKAHTLYITKEIPKYVTLETDRSFPVPCGLVRLHDAAALAVDPATLDNPSGIADGEACPVKASDLAGISVFNYGLYHEAAAQIEGLQNLSRSLAAAAAGKPISK